MNQRLGTRIPLEGTINTRDMGGYLTEDGRRVKFGRLYRTDALLNVTENDIKKLSEEMNMKVVVDLRSYDEVSRVGKRDKEIPGCQMVINPVQGSLNECLPAPFPHEDFPIDRPEIKGTVEYLFRINETGDIKEAFGSVYRSFIRADYGRKQYSTFLKMCADNKEGGFAFHCADGKDRAGVAAAIIFMALGVSDEDIIYDYLLTNENIKEKANAREKYLREDCHITNETVITSIRTIAGVRENWIRSFLDEVEQLGGRKKFFNEYLDFSDEQLAEMRDNYLE